MAEDKPFIETFDVIVIAIVAILGALYLFRDKIFKKKEEEKSVWGSTNGATSGKSRDFIEKMKEGNKNCILFYGSQTGTAEDYAGRLAKEGAKRFGLRCMTADIEEFDMDKLDQFPEDSLAFFVMATYGEGEPTDNAVEFWENISGEEPTFSESTDEKPLTTLKYVVFGLGNKTYEHYNEIGRVLDSKLEKLGATRVAARGEGDDDGSLEEDFLGWKDEMWEQVQKVFNLEEGAGAAEATWEVTELPDADPEDVYLGEHSEHALKGSKASFDARNPYLAPIAIARELYNSKERNCLHMELDISGSGLDYLAGDHVAVWPVNAEEQVDAYLKVLGLISKRDTVIDVKNLDPTANKKHPFPVPTTYETIFRHYLEINNLASRQLLSTLANNAPNEEAKAKLARLGNDKQVYKTEVSDKGLTLAQVLSSITPTWNIPLDAIIDGLPRLQPRYYSISSSPRQSEKVHITAVVNNFHPDGAKDVTIYGVATNYLQHAKHVYAGESHPATAPKYSIMGPRDSYVGAPNGAAMSLKVPVHIRRSNFKLPTNPATPVIMIGPGSGVAPMRGFFQERAKQAEAGKPVGETILFFGCRRQDEDFLYKEEWDSYISAIGKDKAKLFTAFSRQNPDEKVYVQQRLTEQEELVWDLIQKGAYIYVCGDAKNMAKDVQRVLIGIVGQRSGGGEAKGQQTIKDMRDRNKYQEDVWS